MKQLLCLCFFLLAIASCDESCFEASDKLMSSNCSDLTSILEDEAVQIAINFRNQLEPTTRNSFVDNNLVSVSPIGRSSFNNFTRGNGTGINLPDTAAYVINFPDSGGYVIVSANKLVGDVLAYVEDGNLYSLADIDNPGLRFYFENLADYYMEQLKSPIYDTIPGPRDNPVACPLFTDSLISPLLKTKWGQGHPYNKYCTDSTGVVCPTGCVATAIGQLAAYHEHPDSCGNHFFDWFWMTLMVVPTYDDAVEGVAWLMQDIGRITHTEYNQDGSGVRINYVIPCLDSLGYNHRESIEPYDFDICLSEIANERPVLVKGNNGDSQNSHIWVIDGILIRSAHATFLSGSKEVAVRTHITNYVHCNWGWEGSQNGYFISGVFDSSRKEAESTITRGDFSQNVGMWYGIYPKITEQ